jgi:hypothetical protein
VADQLATPQDLASLLQLGDYASLTADQQAGLTVVVEAVTAVVQEAAANQRLVTVVDDTAHLIGTAVPLLYLPQRPVTAVTSVTVDGVAFVEGTDYKVLGTYILRRPCGWESTALGQSAYLLGSYNLPGYVVPGLTEPTNVVVVYSHGYQSADQDLQLARSAVLSIGRTVWPNPGGATQVRIDDYAAVYDAAAATMEASPNLRNALRRKYGLRARLVQVGR